MEQHPRGRPSSPYPDQNTARRTAGSGTNLNVTASTWDQLKDVRVGAFGKWIGTEWEGEKLPKFADYLALLSLNSIVGSMDMTTTGPAASAFTSGWSNQPPHSSTRYGIRHS